ncbi:MAG: hypothetical protein AB1540_06420 [Bdellovibrionota bacterium]
MNRAGICLWFILFFVLSCSSDYRDIATENGRQAVIDEATNHLTAGLCDRALETLSDLYNSDHVDNEVRQLYASAYACKGGLNFPSMFVALKDSPDIWNALIKSNYSAGTGDLKVDNMLRSAEILRETSSIEGNYFASTRPRDVNAYMVFVQLNLISLTLSPLGAANPDDGKRRKPTPICSPAATCIARDQCRVAVAVANIRDSIDSLPSGPITDKISIAFNAACSAVGGGCPTVLDPSDAACTAAMQVQGQVLIDTFASQWGT